MDLLWRGDEFINPQYDNFIYADKQDDTDTPEWPPTNATVVSHFSPDANHPKYEGRHPETQVLSTSSAWKAWLDNVPASDADGPPSVSIIFFPRMVLDGEGKDPSVFEVASLSSLPISRSIFESVVGRMHIHQAFQLAVSRGQAIIFRLDGNTMTGLKQRSYILRTSSTFSHDLALSVTYIPEKRRLYATFLGCTPDDVEWIQVRLQLGTGKTALAPLTLISAFLEREKRNRFAQIRTHDAHMFELVENFSDETPRSQAYAWASDEDPKDLVRTSRSVTFIKSHLEKWKVEILGLKAVNSADQEDQRDFQKSMDDPAVVAGGNAISIPLIDPDSYLSRLAAEYDDQIRKCDAILSTASLAFQMETAGNARREADKVKIIAVVTMVFLPATFLSTLFAMGMFEWRPEKPSEGDSKPGDGGGQDDGVVSLWFWKLYIPLSLGLTSLVLGLYCFWKPVTRVIRRRKQQAHQTNV